MGFFDKLVAFSLPVIPKAAVRKVASRYIAGETVDDAVRIVKDLMAKGLCATLDVLGENVTEVAVTRREVDRYKRVLDRIAAERLDCNVSIKLTQIGLRIDKQLARNNLAQVVQHAGKYGNFVRIDMEDSSCTSDTIDLYRDVRRELPNVGVVIQAYLRRSKDDIARLVAEKAHFRLCKGIYVEPPEIAFQEMEEINASYVQLLDMIFGGGCYVGIATHDERLVEAARALIRKHGLQRNQYEFQMLLGVREGLRDELVREGHRVRIYVPFGEAWYAYSLRRLRENPRIAGHVLRSMFTRG